MEKAREFTATLYILSKEGEKVLLIKHPKLGKWLPPGGHMEKGELPHETALREAMEETGYLTELILQENVWVKEWNAESFPRPYMCLVEEIPAWKERAPHQHVDFIYLGVEVARVSSASPDHHEMRWFSHEELNLLSQDELFDETKNVLQNLFSFRLDESQKLSCFADYKR